MKLFKTPESYNDMLNTIGWYTFGFLVLYVLIIRSNIPQIDDFLAKYEPGFTIPVVGIDFKFFTVFVPVVFAVLSRSIKLHDKLSDNFKIRQSFDVNHILKVYVQELGYKDITEEVLISNRHILMSKVFYNYVSTTPGKEKIDRHYIILALDQWIWFWIILEANFYLFFVAFLFYFVYWQYALTFTITIILSIIFMRFSYSESIKNAKVEINQILYKKEYSDEIRGVFDDLYNE